MEVAFVFAFAPPEQTERPRGGVSASPAMGVTKEDVEAAVAAALSPTHLVSLPSFSLNPSRQSVHTPSPP